ncbi:MAG: sugar ABC transporter permease [Caldilineaceae bacterium SB0662_bin_9]|uniref:Sugar ABC transporter permease n=1 Tax=Caldilineaceae bacterium SB0662_bin_9 TaxID=2605258 RepID=A0A6B1DXC7_9CHLR|nr:sugar ABC transporter permease [Caldilineaceae bacterium]MXZ23830.1 sugar ABC transporter permease [Caldilineaceae bacterium SB0665_bin_21]MXZ42499.1 sugar ABC transporter permease [Caldilineaceae bacterium SB0666_bin_21]MYA04397.1 sugar ABC transporter permease [Caldilineaceae bacterium SB0664_bin_22]MYC61913.1 sugar ABC transporter permease [Caldilineaceae bacterium SB0661_bin_34]MYD91676.1 sugar ABC transporter permease [Caldilineaceae bacterium SB0662_bin_9]
MRSWIQREFLYRRRVYGVLFVAPAMLFFLVFSLYPTLNGFYLSLTEYTLLKPPVFVGFENYTKLAGNDQFQNGVKVTLWFLLGTTVPKWILSLALAMLFLAPFRGREFFKTLYFTPTLLSAVVVSLVWKLLLDPNGVISALAKPITRDPDTLWLSDRILTPISLIFVDDWAGIPFFMIIWIAGLVGIPRVFYEAALIDGTTRWQAFLHVTLPLLRPTILFVVVISTINSFQSFALQYVMTRGGPSDLTTTIALLVYNYGFNYFRMGQAAAMSVFMFFVIILITLIYIRSVRAEETSYT